MTEQKSTRDGFGDALLALAEKNKDIVVIDADLADSLRVLKFKEKYPDRFFECGVAEQNMIGVASGLAMTGKIPFATSFSVFIERCFEQIKVSVCYSNVNVKIIGSHAGLVTGQDGATHQALEDIGIMRTLPNMTIVVPCDYNEAMKATKAITELGCPCYLRLGRPKLPIITNESDAFKIGKANLLKEGKDLTIIAAGDSVHDALEAAKLLEKKNISTKVINMHTIKPIDKDSIINAAKQTKAIITVEDHNIINGLGSAVAEVIAESHPTKFKRIGINDLFGQSGSPEELKKKYRIDSSPIVKAALELVEGLK